ncbi:hypothetical protein, partial [Eggerthella sinensis]|uniref:hypothetical protein n=1 Tax=Eggerthella sinensis TaxID=242230 RepID=UPI00248DDA1C
MPQKGTGAPDAARAAGGWYTVHMFAGAISQRASIPEPKTPVGLGMLPAPSDFHSYGKRGLLGEVDPKSWTVENKIGTGR